VRSRQIITLEKMEFPAPVISGRWSRRPRRPGKDGPGACSASPRKTPHSASTPDQESGQTIISGMGELHLEIIVDA